MNQKDMRIIDRCFGTAVLGPRGQLVIPVEARKKLGIDTGDKFLVFGNFEGLGLMLIKVEVAEQMINDISSQLDEVARLVKESKTADIRMRGEGSQG